MRAELDVLDCGSDNYDGDDDDDDDDNLWNLEHPIVKGLDYDPQINSGRQTNALKKPGESLS